VRLDVVDDVAGLAALILPPKPEEPVGTRTEARGAEPATETRRRHEAAVEELARETPSSSCLRVPTP